LNVVQVFPNIAGRLKIELDLDPPLIAIRPGGADAGNRCEGRFQRIGDVRADLLRSEIARVGEDLDAGERDRRENASRRDREAPTSERETADYGECNEARRPQLNGR